VQRNACRETLVRFELGGGSKPTLPLLRMPANRQIPPISTTKHGAKPNTDPAAAPPRLHHGLSRRQRLAALRPSRAILAIERKLPACLVFDPQRHSNGYRCSIRRGIFSKLTVVLCLDFAIKQGAMMSEKPKSEMMSRRRIFSLFGGAAALSLVVPVTVMTVTDAEARVGNPASAVSIAGANRRDRRRDRRYKKKKKN
jgi:hypothetical protein